jgi:hypothetical protein
MNSFQIPEEEYVDMTEYELEKVKIPQHLSLSNEHFTPLYIVGAARKVFGGEIDTDPATTEDVNLLRVNAKTFYTEETNGLAKENKWHGNVFLNPPGGKEKNKSRQLIWFKEAHERYMSQEIDSLIFIGFNIEILRLAAYYLDYSTICMPSYRIAYDKYDYVEDDFVESKSPPHATAIIYFGKNQKAFRYHFAGMGKVWRLEKA